VSRDPRQGGTFALRGYPAGYYVMGVEREGCVTDRFWVRLCGSCVDTLAVALGTPPCDLGCPHVYKGDPRPHLACGARGPYWWGVTPAA
jgi:hypothetical protein